MNYSGMHDSSISVVTKEGEPLFAASLERLTRIKQDGRFPIPLVEHLLWENIAKVAISTPKQMQAPAETESFLHPCRLSKPRIDYPHHPPNFMMQINRMPGEKIFVGHHEAHAASAFWGSGFDRALCLTYDGGMFNDPWFGGLYRCDRKQGILPLDRFNIKYFAKITTLYTFITALLGFSPNRHEGKITGLAAFGKPTEQCRRLLRKWFEEDYYRIEATIQWIHSYGESMIPQFIPSPHRMKYFADQVEGISKEDMAAAIQEFTEQHIIKILENARLNGWESTEVCLAGGLFANVKINQRVVDSGFRRIFVAPPMTDDGTALGAAWYVAQQSPCFNPYPLQSMFLGPVYSPQENLMLVKEEGINFQHLSDPANKIAELLADGAVIAIFQGAMEFGPRALGNRSILAPAIDPQINQTLNRRLSRTEFMPFAPITRYEDAEECYQEIDRVLHAAEFMTVTVPCTEWMKQICPAVVHVDGTARPQLVKQERNFLLYKILSHYRSLTGKPAVINTSFNIHEEPIVCSPEDALRGFFESGIDYLYMEGVGLIPFRGNETIAVRYLQNKLRTPSIKNQQLLSLLQFYDHEQGNNLKKIEEKELEIQNLDHALKETRIELEKKEELIRLLNATTAEMNKRMDCDRQGFQQQMEEKDGMIRDLHQSIQAYQYLAKIDEKNNYLDQIRQNSEHSCKELQIALEEKEKVIRELSDALRAYRLTFQVFGFILTPLKRILNRMHLILRPRLGNLYQHTPRRLILPASYQRTVSSNNTIRISLVTPSFCQSKFIERTIQSVISQNYPNLEYVIQDGGSNDGTREILTKYSSQLTGWESQPDNGQACAINRGFSKTTGEVMAWLNSDDILLPGSLAYVSDYFSQHPKVDVVYGNRFLIDEEDRLIGRWMLPKHDNKVLSWADYIPQETLFWRRRIWERVGGKVDETFHFAIDWDLLIRFREAGGVFAHLPRFLGGFRVHAEQKTSADISKVGFEEMARIRRRLHGQDPSPFEIRKALFSYLSRHIIIDLFWRIRRTVGLHY